MKAISSTTSPHRIVWAFAVGYFFAYMPYCAAIKMVTSGAGAYSGLVLLPSTILGTLIAAPVAITMLGWWKYLSMPPKNTLISGIGMGIIIGTTTLAYTFRGVSVIFALLLMRGGMLILAPIVDAMFRRTVRWFSWGALALSVAACVVAFFDVKSYDMTLAAAIDISAYLFGYAVRYPAMTRAAKIADDELTRRYLVQELLVATIVLAAIPTALAFGNAELRRGWQACLGSPILLPGLSIGIFYVVLYFFATLVYLDRRENTFCIPLNCCASLLSGIAVSYLFAGRKGFAPPSVAQLGAAALIMTAVFLLSPAHHIFEFAWWRKPVPK
jgi:hypothetical protein